MVQPFPILAEELGGYRFNVYFDRKEMNEKGKRENIAQENAEAKNLLMDGWMDGWRSVSKANKLAVTEND